MADKQLTYKIIVDTATAARGARNVRAVFEHELRQIKMGRLNTSALTQAVTEAKHLRTELEQAANASNRVRPPAQRPGGGGASPLPAASNTDFFTSGIEDSITQVKALAAGYIGLQGVIAAIDLSKLGTQALRTYSSLNILAGGGKQAEEVLKAVQKASNGTVTEMEAAGIATQGFALKLARTPAEFEKLTRAAREITQVSPIIKDVGEALTQLALFASNEQSFARADQLGLAVTEVKDRMAELRRENDSLSGSQAKLLASIQLLDEKYGATLDTIEAQASGIERLRVAWEDAKVSFATADSGVVGEFFSVDKFAGQVANMIGSVTGDYTEAEFAVDRLGEAIERMQRQSKGGFLTMPWDTLPTEADIAGVKSGLDSYKKALTEIDAAVAANVPGAKEYQQQLAALTEQIGISGGVTDAQAAQLQEIHTWYEQAALSVVKLSEAEKLRASNKITADQFEQSRQGAIFEQQPAIEQALAGRASKAAGVAGLEQTIALYRQQKALVDQAIQQLIDSGVSDQNEIAIRVADVVAQLTEPFDALEARASQFDISAALGNFDQVGTALSNINASFTDLLPGVASAREELANLSMEMALTGQLSDEQAARLDYLSAVAYSVADGGSALNDVVSELGSGFLESNAYAAELVNQMFLADAAFRQGAIGSDVYAGIMAVLSGQLLTVAQTAGVATGAIQSLTAAQAGLASSGGLTIGNSIANRIQSTQGASARDHNRKEMDRYNKDQARAAQSAARHQETSARKAGKLLEDGARKANQELKSALDKVPGLFSTTQVSEQDMKDGKLGIYTDKVDEKLRRLKDEVLNGVDWADVSIEDAQAAIEKIGVKAANTKEGVLQQFEDLWNSQALWADMSNIEQWIDKGAVEQQLSLQQKSEEGRNNIYKFFGVQIDEAVNSVTGGGGGGGYTPPEIRPPDLIDVDPLREGLQTGLDEYVNANGEIVKEQMAKAKVLFFDPANLFAPGAKMGGVSAGAMGPVAKPEITITADATAQAWLPVLTGQAPAPTVALGVVGPQPAPSATVGDKTKLLISDYYDVVTPEGGKVKLLATDFFAFDGSIPAETINRANLVTFTNALPVEQVNRARLVSFLSELPTEQIDRSALVAFVNNVGKEEIDRSGLVSFLSELPTEQVDRSTLIGYINSLTTETVDRANLVAFANALPAENIDRSALVSFLNTVPSEAVDRQTLVSYLNSVPTETIDRANVVSFLNVVPTEQVDRSALVIYAGAVPTFTINLSEVLKFTGDAIASAQNKLYELLYGPSPEKPDTLPGITDSGPYAIDIQAQLSPAAYQGYLDYKAQVEANPPTIMPMIQAPGQRLGDVESLGTVDVTATITKFDVAAQIDEKALSSLTAPIVYAPQDDAQADFITPLVGSLASQISANEEQIGAQGATVAQIIIAAIVASFQGDHKGQQGEGQASLASAMALSLSTQIVGAEAQFEAVGALSAGFVQGGYKAYQYTGLADSFDSALGAGINAIAANLGQRGGMMAGYVQAGFVGAFSSETFKTQLIAVGELMYKYIEIGMLAQINGGALANAIAAQVVDDMNAEMEQP
jgi:hypothetical protein